MLARKLLMAGQTPIIYATFSPDAARKNSNITLSNGNLTATNTGINGHFNIFLNTDKTIGKWACEFTNPSGFTGSAVSSFGFSTALTLGTSKIGLFSQGIGYQPYDGARNVYVSGGVTTTNYWRTISTANTKHIVVFDFDNKQLICLNNANTALLSSSAGAIGSPLYIGISLYAQNLAIILNAGQSAFTAGNEALIAAYETANSITINRGLWA